MSILSLHFFDWLMMDENKSLSGVIKINFGENLSIRDIFWPLWFFNEITFFRASIKMRVWKFLLNFSPAKTVAETQISKLEIWLDGVSEILYLFQLFWLIFNNLQWVWVILSDLQWLWAIFNNFDQFTTIFTDIKWFLTIFRSFLAIFDRFRSILTILTNFSIRILREFDDIGKVAFCKNSIDFVKQISYLEL